MKPRLTRTLAYLILSAVTLGTALATLHGVVVPALAQQEHPHAIVTTAQVFLSDPGKWAFTGAIPVGPPSSLTSSAPAQPAGIYGRVTNNGQLIGGIPLELRRYDASSETTVATTTTDSSGNYIFSGVPSLPSGYRYYVRYGPNSTNSSYVALWFGPDIATYTEGSSQPGGDFDIADVKMQAPPGGASLPFPITYRWTLRAVPLDSYMVHVFKDDGSVYWNSPNVGYADQVTQTSLPPGMSYNQSYLWHPIVFMAADSFGIPFYSRVITFLPTSTPRAVFLPLIQRMPTPTATPTMTPPAPGCDPYEPNDTRSAAWGPLFSGQTYYARLCRGDREDWYHLNAQPGQPIIANLNLPSTLVGYTAIWFYFESNTQALACEGAGRVDTANKTITCPVTQSGRYFVRMYTDDENRYFDDYNDYTLRATFVPAGVGPTVTPTRTPSPTPFATTRTLTAVADATILEGYPGFNAGTTNDMWAGYDDGRLSPPGRIVRSLIKFDLSGIPSSATVQSARLRVYYAGYWDYPNRVRTITAYRIVGDWTERGVTWNNKPSPGTAYGSVAINSDQNWGWRELDVGALVQGWINGSIPNQGVMLRGPEASGADSSFRIFSTREGPYPPQLVIQYLASGAASLPVVIETPVPAGPSLREYLNASDTPGN